MCSCGGFVVGLVMAVVGVLIAIFGGVLRPDALRDVEYSPHEGEQQLLAFKAKLLCGEAADGQTLSLHHPFDPSCYRPGSQQPQAFDGALNGYAIGRYKGPLRDFNHPPLTGGQKLAEWKEFLWSSVTDGEWLIDTCMMDLGYIHLLVVGLFNRETKESYTRQIELPLLLGEYFGPHWSPGNGNSDTLAAATSGTDVPGPISVSNGCIRLTPLFDDSYGSSCAREAKDGTPIRNLTFSLRLNDDRDGHPMTFYVDWEFAVGTSRESESDGPQVMSLVFPLGPRRAAMVTKGAGINSWRPSRPVASPSAATGDRSSSNRVRFTLGGVPHELKAGALAAFDYTRGLLRRHSRWNWIALSVPVSRLVTDTDVGREIHRGVGLHLSTTVYAVANNITAENSVWKDNALAPFEFPLTFTKARPDAHASQTSWTISGGPASAVDGRPVLDLTFEPFGRFQGDINYLVIYGELTHLWGIFTGRVPTPTARGWEYVEIRSGGTPGVFEFKDAHW